MLAEQRLEEIIRVVEEKGSATVQELMELLDASESTIRRDLITLNNNGRLIKVHGGAIAQSSNFMAKDNDVASRQNLNMDEKNVIGKYACSLLQESDFVYMDAGTTTECMISFLSEHINSQKTANKKSITFVTNSIAIAKKISKMGYGVHIIGGELKFSTEAIVGAEAIDNLSKYNFTKGFFGTNGVNERLGLTTPDVNEAMVKKAAIERCQKVYVLADSTKFNLISPVTFAEFDKVKIITTIFVDDKYKEFNNILEVKS